MGHLGHVTFQRTIEQKHLKGGYKPIPATLDTYTVPYEKGEGWTINTQRLYLCLTVKHIRHGASGTSSLNMHHAPHKVTKQPPSAGSERDFALWKIAWRKISWRWIGVWKKEDTEVALKDFPLR